VRLELMEQAFGRPHSLSARNICSPGAAGFGSSTSCRRRPARGTRRWERRPHLRSVERRGGRRRS